MTFVSKQLVSCVFCALMLNWVSADTVTLKQGQVLKGDIVVERDNKIFLDIGITVLSINKDDIEEYKYAKSEQLEQPADANAADANRPVVTAVTTDLTRPPGQFYYTTVPQKKTIEQSVQDVQEAVLKVSTPAGLGSGFFINENGYLITNYHVIENETRIEVTMFIKAKDGFEKIQFKKVKIEAINPFIDLALLKVEDLGGQAIKYVPLGDMDNLQVGEKVYAIGTPLGLERTVTDGVVSTKNRAFEGLTYIQTNADINPGNSGGPLFNLAGEVVGVTNMGYIFFGGLGFAIPVDYVKHFVENRDAFVYDKDNPNSGFRYLQPDSRRNKSAPQKNDKKK